MASLIKGLQRIVFHPSLTKQYQHQALFQPLGISNRPLSTCRSLKSSQSDSPKSEDKVVMSDDGRVIVCWHPEVPIPYELTSPMPQEITPTDSVLKVQALYPTKEIFRRKRQQMVIQELMNLTYTTKHRWFPKKRRLRYRDLNPNNEKSDREYL